MPEALAAPSQEVGMPYVAGACLIGEIAEWSMAHAWKANSTIYRFQLLLDVTP
jgi:hypothetical protein